MIKKKCIQLQIGSQIYQFNDVEFNSTSLSDIIRGLSKTDENRKKIRGILEDSGGSIDAIFNSESNSYIGDNVVGNLNLNNLLTILKSYRNPLVDAGFEILVSNMTYNDNNILVTSENTPTTLYHGTTRDLLIIGGDVLRNPRKLFNAISYLYVSNQLKNTNSKISRIFTEGIQKLAGTVEEINNINADSEEAFNKVLLSKLPSLAHIDAVKEHLLIPIANTIKNTTAKKVHTTTNRQVSNAIEFANTTTTINGNTYSNGFIIKTLEKISRFKDTIDRTGDRMLDSKLYKYFESIKDSAPEYRLLSDIVNNPDAAFVDYIFGEGDYRTNLLNYLYKPEEIDTEVPIEIERFYPLVENARIDDDFAVKESRINISSYNNQFTKMMTQNAKKAFQLVLDSNQKTFVKVDDSKTTVKIIINPNLEYNREKDLETILNAITTIKNKQRQTSRTILYVLNREGNYDPSGNVKIEQLIKDLRTNANYITHVYVAGTQDFGLAIAKAANKNRVYTVVYPEYYGSIRAFGDIYSYLDEALNLNYMSNHEDTDENLDNIRNDTQRVVKADKSYKEGDVISLRNGNDTVNKSVSRVIDMGKPSQSVELFEFGYYKVGSIVMVESRKGKLVEGFVMGYNEDSEAYDVYVPTDSKVVELGDINPIYTRDTRVIGEYTYIHFGPKKLYRFYRGIVEAVHNAEEFAKFYAKELHDIHSNTKNAGRFEEFVYDNFSKLDDFAKFVVLKPLTKENLTPNKVLPDNYSSQAVVELIVGSLRRSGLNVAIYGEDYIRDTFGTEVASHKAFIHNGGIILNANKYTEDSALHEFMHLLLGQYKLDNPTEYRNLLQEVPNTQEYIDLAETYSELTSEDYAEEVLVHVLTDALMGKIYDRNINHMINFDVKTLAEKLLQSTTPIRESSQLLETALSKLLLDSNSSILNNLLGGERRSDIILNNQISNLKSKLLKNGELKQDCK